MDLSTILGIIAAFALMISAILSGGPLTLFINPPGLLIVVGGTLGATLVHYPFKDIFGAFAVLKKAFMYQNVPPQQVIQQLLQFSSKARREGILSLQSMMEGVEDLFFLKSLQMAVDGQDPESLKNMLYQEIEYIQERHDKGATIFISMGNYAPAMGMIGTLIGLVQMLQTMDDPSTIGPAMAIALLTTFYGAIIANVVCMPISGKLKNRSQSEVLNKTLITEGMDSILLGENPRIMEQKLHAFIAPKLRENNKKTE